MQPGSAATPEMVDVALFGRRTRPQTPDEHRVEAESVQNVLNRLDAVVDRLEGVYAQLAPHLPDLKQSPGNGDPR